MTTVYLIRHAQAQGNLDHVFQGHYDGKITELGYRQLERLAQACKGLQLDCVYSSPLSRAYETAKAVVTQYGYPIQIEDDLIELNGGNWEQQKWSSFALSDPIQHENWQLRPYEFCAPNGEPMKTAYERIKKVTLQIVEKNKDKTICIVSHGGVLSCLFNWVMGNEPTQLSNESICDNTGISKVEFDDFLQPTLKMFNNTEHLDGDLHVSVRRMWKK